MSETRFSFCHLVVIALLGSAAATGRCQDHRDPAREAALAELSRKMTDVNKEFHRARSKMLDGQFDEAVNICRAAVTKYPDLAQMEAHCAVPILGEIYLQKGDLREAIEEFSGYQDPGSKSTVPNIEASLALSYLRLGDIDDANAVLVASAKASPDRLSSLLGNEHVPDLQVEDATTIEATCLLIRGTEPTDDRRIAQLQLGELKLAKKRLPTNLGIDWLIGFAEFQSHDYAGAVKSLGPLMQGKDEFLKNRAAGYYRMALERAARSNPSPAKVDPPSNNRP